MRLLSKIAVGVSLQLLLTGASAQAPAAGTTAQASADEGRINIVAQKLCKGEPVVGTRLAPKRKCDTPAQLERYRAQAREMIEEYKRRPCMAGVGTGENDIAIPC